MIGAGLHTNFCGSCAAGGAFIANPVSAAPGAADEQLMRLHRVLKNNVASQSQLLSSVHSATSPLTVPFTALQRLLCNQRVLPK